jgi:hypothetical protein
MGLVVVSSRLLFVVCGSYRSLDLGVLQQWFELQRQVCNNCSWFLKWNRGKPSLSKKSGHHVHTHTRRLTLGASSEVFGLKEKFP